MTEEPLELKDLTANELIFLCLNLYEEAQRTLDLEIKKRLIKDYNEAANYYNLQIAKAKTFQLC